ncbi:MAG: DNA-directed RNA polymerase subunit alpha [Zetaproteobacteria bacterium CG12_big_fil_rev_8_21_14_0_65_54_13]|nr:MAG: DNA-directed RNA polymerase subunit alpha [Zetaproteobacteria bacterium CG23_combo_of_CG06-09_8_20_14_all_54_7]PIW49134.1 MAG: DNA-directed RNA polymerase subunit alpha [Zetaproteobacteria bacterium CG12_big_fil_rev_8_21_14_0_65_54_13]PIX55921.1 MAG: DNA-directed RNA polymerase subunit alpha [Zetaproteobacteria bacterium CG_4_10_14_3_um_filter_54_28]PJA30517.1 MAG: DNA-directed RNA polymerase subunit alpha [Zetaproteobacteria bacterium CG_4_9_14_3_um_filter_54_145]
MQLINPRHISIEEKVPGRAAKIVFEPLERGYGTTIGNSLRRMLLSSLPGAAVTSVLMDGVAHEYDSIKGVREDVMDIILSLKELDLRMEGDDAATISLDIKGSSIVTAADIKCPAGLTVLNPELILAHLNDDAHLKIEARVEKGRGYEPATEREVDERPVGSLLVDASYSPIRRVSTRVESARVGQRTNYDKLIMEIETNGSLSPEEALNSAARILEAQLAVFVDFENVSIVAVEENIDDGLDNLLIQPIEHLDLSVRSMNCLKSDDVFRVGDLVQRSEQEMLRTPNFGRKSLNEIKEVLENMGLELGMDLPNWPPQDDAEVLED